MEPVCHICGLMFLRKCRALPAIWFHLQPPLLWQQPWFQLHIAKAEIELCCFPPIAFFPAVPATDTDTVKLSIYFKICCGLTHKTHKTPNRVSLPPSGSDYFKRWPHICCTSWTNRNLQTDSNCMQTLQPRIRRLLITFWLTSAAWETPCYHAPE